MYTYRRFEMMKHVSHNFYFLSSETHRSKDVWQYQVTGSQGSEELGSKVGWDVRKSGGGHDQGPHWLLSSPLIVQHCGYVAWSEARLQQILYLGKERTGLIQETSLRLLLQVAYSRTSELVSYPEGRDQRQQSHRRSTSRKQRWRSWKLLYLESCEYWLTVLNTGFP
jgi:hypothetical protein